MPEGTPLTAVSPRPGPALPALPPRPKRRLAIVGATVVPMTGPDTLSDHTVLIDDGIITAVGPRTATDVEGAQVVDGRGRFLMPGLTDAHVHMASFDDVGLYLAAGVTRVRHMFGYPEHVAYARLVEAGRWAGPRMHCASTIVDGINPSGHPYWAGSIVIDDPAGASALVGKLKSIGYVQLKCYSLLSPAVHEALGRACLDQGLPLGGHCPTALTMEQAIENGQRSFEHLCGMGRGRLGPVGNEVYEQVAATGLLPELNPEVITTLIEHLDRSALHRLAEQMRDQQVWNCPTLVVSDHPLRPPGAFNTADWLDFVPPRYRAMWDAAIANSPRHADLERLRARWCETLRDAVAVLHEAGAPLLAGTDTANPWVAPGAALAEELANLVAAGLSNQEALRCATVEPARFLGLPEGAATIAPGQLGDLVLLDGNPLADVGAVRRPHAVFANGWYLDRSALDTLRDVSTRQWEPVVAEPAGTPPPPGAQVRAAGHLQSRVFGFHNGSVGYRCTQLPDGEQELDEVENLDSARIERHLSLTASGHLRRASVRRITPVGTTSTLADVRDGHLTVRSDDHGQREQVSLPVAGPVVAGPGLAATALQFAAEGPADALVVDAAGAYVAPVRVTRDGDAATAHYEHPAVPVNWRLGAAATQVSSVDGAVVAVLDIGRDLVSDSAIDSALREQEQR